MGRRIVAYHQPSASMIYRADLAKIHIDTHVTLSSPYFWSMQYYYIRFDLRHVAPWIKICRLHNTHTQKKSTSWPCIFLVSFRVCFYSTFPSVSEAIGLYVVISDKYSTCTIENDLDISTKSVKKWSIDYTSPFVVCYSCLRQYSLLATITNLAIVPYDSTNAFLQYFYSNLVDRNFEKSR